MTTENELLEVRSYLKLTEELLEEQYRIMDSIPPCPAHGNRCVPYAVEWLNRVITLGEIIFKGEEVKNDHRRA